MSNQTINERFRWSLCACLHDEQITSDRELILFITNPEFVDAEFENYINTKDDLPDFEDGTLELLEDTKNLIIDEAKFWLYKRTEKEIYKHGTGAFNDEGYQTEPLDYADVKDIVEVAPMALFLCGTEFHQDTELQKLHLKKYPENYGACNRQIRSDLKYSQSIFRQEPHQIAHASEQIRNDLKTALICVKADPASIHNAGPVPNEIYKNAGYSDKGLAALKRAIELEKLHDKLHKTVTQKPTQSHQRKI